jgi:hypothetical protein
VFGVEENIRLIESSFRNTQGATFTDKAIDLWLNEVSPSRISR